MVDSFADYMASNPAMQMGLAVMRGDSPAIGQKMALMAQEQQALQAERQRAEQTRQALGQALSRSGGITMDAVQEMMAIDPEVGLRLLQQKRLMDSEERKEQMMQAVFGGGDFGGGDADMTSRMAMAGVMAGDPNMLAGAQFLETQRQKSPEVLAELKLAEKQAVNQADDLATLSSLSGKMPSLVDTVNQLSALGESATYTEAGKAADWLARQAGVATPGAVARTNYESIVNNQILPLLRDTFGAQFTEREGESLKATLGSPDKTPEEKNAVLQSFIRQKANDIEALGSQYNVDTSYIKEALAELKIGKSAKDGETSDIKTLRKQAQEAISAGRSEQEVRRMFKQMTGEDF